MWSQRQGGVTHCVTRVSRSVTRIFFITLLRARMREKKSHIITHPKISVTKKCVRETRETRETCTHAKKSHTSSHIPRYRGGRSELQQRGTTTNGRRSTVVFKYDISGCGGGVEPVQPPFMSMVVPGRTMVVRR